MTPNPSLTRRQALGAASATGVAFLFAGRAGALDLGAASVAEAASATCVMTPAKTEGPYFVDEKLNRSDIRSDTGTGAVQGGTPLALTMYVFDAAGDCAPVQGAQVDVWHANAAGEYSDVAQNGTVGVDWLRGFQVTDGDGKVTFRTIWPGWYQGRAVHIHFKVRTSGGLEFTSQLFFTDAMNTAVFGSAPYAARGDASLKDSGDGIYGTDGASLLLSPTSDGAGGYAADFSVGISGGGSSGTDTTVAAAITSVKAVRLANGARQVRVRLRPEEPVTARVKVTRAGHTLAQRKLALTAGSHTLRLPLGRTVKAGGARVTIRLTDGVANTRTSVRTVHVPKRRRTTN
jgi:protocatechuate 3,4-dioxygenase beta subunit